jgi:hypothetical protein
MLAVLLVQIQQRNAIACLIAALAAAGGGSSWWVIPKQHSFWEDLLSKTWRANRDLEDREYRKAFRMCRPTFRLLLERLRPEIERMDTR